MKLRILRVNQKMHFFTKASQFLVLKYLADEIFLDICVKHTWSSRKVFLACRKALKGKIEKFRKKTVNFWIF